MLEQIGISKLLNEIQINNIMENIFSGLKFRMILLKDLGKNVRNLKLIKYQVFNTKSDFPTRIELLFPQLEDVEKREQYIAYKISKTYNIETIVGYQDEDFSNEYYNLVFKNNKIYLGDDLESMYAEEGMNNIKIVKELNFEISKEFAKFANYKKITGSNITYQ